MDEKTQTIRDEILETALPDVIFDGWTKAVMAEAAVKAGHSSDMVRAVFPGGMDDVLSHFSDWTDRQMLAALKKVDPEALRIRDRIRTAVLARLEILSAHKDAAKQAAAYWAVPTRSLAAGRIVWRSADVIWNWAGDTAKDYNHYTKRGLLSGVMSSTMLVWLNDDSGEMTETEAFLDRRIENVMQLGKFIGKFKKAS